MRRRKVEHPKICSGEFLFSFSFFKFNEDKHIKYLENATLFAYRWEAI